MRVVSAAEIDAALAYPALVDVLEDAFRVGAIAPPRHHHTIKQPDFEGRPAADATLLLMPAWSVSAQGLETAGRFLGIKVVSVFPDNGRHGLPSIQGAYLLMSAETGVPLALMDAPRITVWRTAAASALAARHLARKDARRLLVVGAGALAPYLVRAHRSVRPIDHVRIWNRSPAGAAKVVTELAQHGISAEVALRLEDAVRDADIISTATLSRTPLVEGAWLRPGTHLDCVGAYRPDMRETDDEVVRRARIWVDTLSGGLNEAGDVVMPLRAGVIQESKIEGDLFALARGTAPVRRSADEITMFKSVGASIEDLAAALAVYDKIAAVGVGI